MLSSGKIRASLFILFLLFALFPDPSPSAGPLTPKAKHGKHIYLKTTSPSGKEIKAYIGIASVEAPGSVMVCANCHGIDGKGRPGSGIIPSNITWKLLSKSYGVTHISGRVHPAYTRETLARAIAKGIDPAGNRLNPAMPVYSMPDEDLEALVEYLQYLGTEWDPGITERTIRIGTILPSGGPAEGISHMIKKTTQAYFEEINQAGGIFGRTLELVVAEFPEGRGFRKEEVNQFFQEQGVFALVSTFTPGLDKEISLLVETEMIPLVGPFTPIPLPDLSLNRYLFYLFSGLREQARALVEYAGRFIRETPTVAILHPAREDLAEVIHALEEHCKSKGWKRVLRIDYLPNRFDEKEWVGRLTKEKVDVILFLGAGSEAIALMREADRIPWDPVFLLSGVLMGKGVNDIPQSLKKKTFLAYPTLPQDRKDRKVRELDQLLKKYSLPAQYSMAQLSAYVSLQILREGLRTAGRELNREKLVAVLEKIYELDTGLTPLITYGPNRRIGALGAYIVTVDPAQAGKDGFISSKEWVALN